MLVPISWLRQYVELPQNPHEIAEMLAQIGFPVESIEERPVITGVVCGRIETLEKHPNADRLQVGKINVGNGQLLTIATAATNVAAGQTIPVAVIGAQLPQIKIERRKMRGLESEGMMISAEELALPAEWFEDGIMQLEEGVELGTDMVEYFGLRDAVLDVEVTGNRVDALCITGIARELAAYQGVPLRIPEPPALQEKGDGVEVSIETPDCTRFVGAYVENVSAGVSPAWMRVRLSLAGQRPINHLVDVSNYVMLEMGQPLHFYDAQLVPGHKLVVRDGADGETLATLDGKSYELTPKDLVIATQNGPAGFAGLMGGADTEVTEKTTSILLEAATFSGPRVRRMSARRGFRTEASSRNEKSLPPSFALTGASRALQLLEEAGARVDSIAIEGSAQDSAAPIDLRLSDIPRLLGFTLTAEEAREYLDRLGFAIDPAGENLLRVTPPLWRRDVTMAADIVEEVARMAGYDRIEPVMPDVPGHTIASDAYALESKIAHTLVALGYREIATVALHGAQTIDRLAGAGLCPTNRPVEVLNPLSEDQRFLRFALGPAHVQYMARIDKPVRVFEIGHVFHQEETGPAEAAMLAFGFSVEPADGPSWRDPHFLALKGDAEALLRALTGRRDIEWAPDKRNGAHPGKTAAALIDGREVAFACQLDPRMQHAFDCRLPVYGCWIYTERIPEYRTPRYEPPSRLPGTYRDLALLCDLDVPAASIQKTIASAIGELCTGVRAFDEYRGAQAGEQKKSLAVRITLVRTDRTITDEEADEAVARALAALRTELGVELRT
ncbi:MAG TPA: phenylalanine--tRNA ligase subunit beta [Candidatus Baltobacteraceae bacterium]|nr:phenylalanine--tRNA ligase subunit beta [Candidatus Baltobacteraceae bacterium]